MRRYVSPAFVAIASIAAGLFLACSTSSPGERSSENGPSTGSETESTEETAKRENGGLTRAELERGIARFDELLGSHAKDESISGRKYRRLIGADPSIDWVHSPVPSEDNVRVESRKAFRERLDTFNHDGFCTPAIESCTDRCCRFDQSMADTCAHYGSPVERLCFRPSSDGPKLSTVWTNCPFEYDVRARIRKGRNALSEIDVSRPSPDYACPYAADAKILVFFTPSCSKSGKIAGEPLPSDGSAVHVGLSCSAASCDKTVKGEVCGTPVQIDLRATLQSHRYNLEDYYEFFPDRRPESSERNEQRTSGAFQSMDRQADRGCGIDRQDLHDHWPFREELDRARAPIRRCLRPLPGGRRIWLDFYIEPGDLGIIRPISQTRGPYDESSKRYRETASLVNSVDEKTLGRVEKCLKRTAGLLALDRVPTPHEPINVAHPFCTP